MSRVKALIAKVRENAKKELEFCNKVDTPYVCAMIETPEGKETVCDLIVEYVGKNSMTIGDAINYIERDQDPNTEN
jgi:hypothetical protein